MTEKKTVPLVVYENGERVEIGEAEVSLTETHFEVAAQVQDTEWLERLKMSEGHIYYSLAPFPPHVEFKLKEQGGEAEEAEEEATDRSREEEQDPDPEGPGERRASLRALPGGKDS